MTGFHRDNEVAEFLQNGPPPGTPAQPPLDPKPIVINGPPGDFSPRGWYRAGARWAALVGCDRERYRSEPYLVGPVTIGGRAYDCIAVECTKLEKQTIHVGEVIGLVLQEARR